jgi:hypothetical protein
VQPYFLFGLFMTRRFFINFAHLDILQSFKKVIVTNAEYFIEEDSADD